MSATRDSMLADPEQLIADLRRQLAECKTERDEALQRETATKPTGANEGFGFVELSDGSGDAFLHGSVLARSGINAVQPGETVEVRVGPGHKGPYVTEVLSVDTSTATPTTPPRSSYRAPTSGGSSA